MYVKVVALCLLTFASVQQSYGFVFGTEVEKVQSPWLISLQYGLQYGHAHICGGSILNSRWVLTAANCIVSRSRPHIQGANFYVVAGIRHKMAHGEPIMVDTVIIHPDYMNSELEGKGIHSDIALLELEDELELGPNVEPVTLPKPDAIPFGGSTLSGWAISTNPGNPNIRQTIDVPVISQEGCEEALTPFRGYEGCLTESNICTGQDKRGQGACFRGEAGSPLVTKDGKEQIGIVSWGPMGQCDYKGAPSIYTRVSAFVIWIYQNIDWEIE